MDQSLTYNQQITTETQPETRAVPRPLLWLWSIGTLGSLLFMLVYLIEGVTRPDYSAWQQAISALSLGPGGWIQQINFIVFGTISILTAFLAHALLKGGKGAVWYPIFRALQGIGLFVDGIFSQDPAPGYPKGALLTPPTLHGELHVIFAFLCITSMACGFFVLARRFAGDPNWRGWAISCAITGILVIVLITTFGIANSHQSAFAGVLERLATGIVSLWGVVFLIRLWQGVPFMAASVQ